MKKAKTSCKAMPQKTARQLIVLRSLERPQATAAGMKIPAKLTAL